MDTPDERPSRKTNRLPSSDYKQNGAFFITACTKERHELFGKIENGIMVPTDLGKLVESETAVIEQVYPSVVLDAFILMPNHIHMLLLLLDNMKNPSVKRILQQWKGAVSKKAEFSPWQERFWDSQIYTATEYRKIKQYIISNPKQWETDKFYK